MPRRRSLLVFLSQAGDRSIAVRIGLSPSRYSRCLDHHTRQSSAVGDTLCSRRRYFPGARVRRRSVDAKQPRAEVPDQGRSSRTHGHLASESFQGDRSLETGPTSRIPQHSKGFHGAHVLVIIDEATGVEGPIWEAIEGARAGGDVRQLVLCNPVVPSGPVYEIFTRQRAQWHTITIDAFDTPNLKCACQQRHGDFTLDMLRSLPPGLSENGHPAFAHKPWPELVSRYWVYEMYWKYGEESAFFESRVRGQFPTQAEDALYSLAKLEAARAKPGEQLDDGVSPVIVGIDVAGPGKDETVVSIRCGSGGRGRRG